MITAEVIRVPLQPNQPVEHDLAKWDINVVSRHSKKRSEKSLMSIFLSSNISGFSSKLLAVVVKNFRYILLYY